MTLCCSIVESINMFYIYAYENKLTGKIYIGQTVDLEQRDRHHSGGFSIKEGSLIDRKIIQYGRDNFDFWTVSVADSNGI